MPAPSCRPLPIIGLVVSLLTAGMAITGGSLWIDEFGTWLITRAESLPAWWLQLKSWPDSDTQILLYHLYMYFWTNLFGTDVWVMRISNLPLFLLATYILILPFRASRLLAMGLILTSCLNAFLWYYLNELRPYIFIYLGATMLYTGAFEFLNRESDINRTNNGVLIWIAGVFVSCGASPLGVPWVGACILFIVVYRIFFQNRKLWPSIKAHAPILLVASAAVMPLLAYQVQMFLRGTRATKLFESNILSVLFSVYSMSGLLGVGPGMLAMREHGEATLVPYLPVVAISGVVLLMVAVGGVLALQSRLGKKALSLAFACVMLPIMFTFLLGYVLHWRVLGRHLMPTLPLLAILYAFGLSWWCEKGNLGKAVILTAILVLFFSALSIRYAPRHQKDDYLHASLLANEVLKNGGEVWWVADYRGARYYNVPYSMNGESWPNALQPHYVKVLSNTKAEDVAAATYPALVLLSKPDIYDIRGVIQSYLNTKGFEQTSEIPAFTIWEPKGKESIWRWGRP